jgi:aminoglycoside 2''-phosphotransferase
MKKEQLYFQRIREKYPDLLVESTNFNDRGQNNDIIIINEELIFRFPKYVQGIKQLEVETSILKGIQDYISLKIPNPIYKSFDRQTVGQVFVGYRMVPGEPLWETTIMTMDNEGKLQSLATQLATFLYELHNVPINEVLTKDLLDPDYYSKWKDTYVRIKEKVLPYMRSDAQQWAVDHFESFLNVPSNFEFKPVLIHGDFGTTNILFDSHTQSISGIIDFGFAGIYNKYGESFLSRFFATYPNIDSVLKRAKFYAGTFALLEALFGIENGDSQAFGSGIETFL